MLTQQEYSGQMTSCQDIEIYGLYGELIGSILISLVGLANPFIFMSEILTITITGIT